MSETVRFVAGEAKLSLSRECLNSLRMLSHLSRERLEIRFFFDQVRLAAAKSRISVPGYKI